LCGLLVTYHAAGSRCVFRDQLLTGVWCVAHFEASLVQVCQLNMHCNDMELHYSSGEFAFMV